MSDDLNVLTDDELAEANEQYRRFGTVSDDVARLLLAEVNRRRAEVRRLRALLTAPPDDDLNRLLDALTEERFQYWSPQELFALARTVRARKIEGDTDE